MFASSTTGPQVQQGTFITRNYKYKRLSRSDSEDEPAPNGSSTDSFELSNKGRVKVRSDKSNSSSKVQEYDTLFERPILEGESLNSISLKYRISVADLKRVNRLQKESEFYALSSLKIPVKNNSILYEILQDEQHSHAETSTEPKIDCASDVESEISIPVGVISISQICREKNTRKEARQFLLNMQKDLQKMQQKTNSYKGSLDEAASSLTTITFSPLEKRMFGCSDMDLSWWKVLFLGGVIIVGVPFFYLLVFTS